MKIAFLLSCLFGLLSTVSTSIRAPLNLITLDDVSIADRELLNILEQKYHYREKRSGSGDSLNAIKASIAQGIKNKLVMIAKSSAGASAHFSQSSSSGDHGHHPHHHPHDDHHDHHGYHNSKPHHEDSKDFDFWSLKKSILNTLLQAVKAIKGGIIALNGHLVKGSGYIVSQKGKLISAKGEAITNLGKHIATSAVLVPPGTHHIEPTPEHHHDYLPPSNYGHAYVPHDEYGAPSAPAPEYEPPHGYHHKDKPNDLHAGILILKKIPPHRSNQNNHHQHHYHHNDYYHEIEHDKIPSFKSLDPNSPSLGKIIGKFFTASTSLTPGEPAPFNDDDIDDKQNKHIHELIHHHTVPDDTPPHHYHNQDSHKKLTPPSTNYGTPFEEAPSYLSTDTLKPPEPLPQETPQNYDIIKPVKTNEDYLQPNSFVGEISHDNDENYPFFPTNIVKTNSINFGENYNGVVTDIKTVIPDNNEFKYPNNFGTNLLPSIPHFSLYKRNTLDKTNSLNLPSRDQLDIVKSIAYELGPNGPKKV